MRLVTFSSADSADARLGALINNDQQIVDLRTAADLTGSGNKNFTSMLALIDAGPAALDSARDISARTQTEGIAEAIIENDNARLHAPLPNPRRLRDCTCFLQHLRNARKVRYTRLAARETDPEAALEKFRASGALDVPPEWGAAPVYLNSNHLSLIGQGDDVIWPHEARRMDYELEWAVITGSGGSNIKAENAAKHFFGFTIFNDVSARDIQAIEIRTGAGMGGPGKDFDAGNAMGPCIVTADELDDPYNQEMVARINGEEWSRGNTSMMDHQFEGVLAHLSHNQSIHPGEIFGSGTVPTGCGLEHNRYLSDGDTIELDVEGIGVLQNRIVKPADWRDRQSPDKN